MPSHPSSQTGARRLRAVRGGRNGSQPPAAEPPRREDIDLASRAAAGDDAALRQLLRGVAPVMLRTVKAVLGVNAHDAEDALQESLLSLNKALPSFRGDCSVSHFGCRIAVRTALRARKRARSYEDRKNQLAADEAALAERAAPSPSTEVAASRRKAMLRQLLDELPEVQAETLAMRVVLGHRLDEIASATEAPVNTVRSRLRLAKEALRRRIEADSDLADIAGVKP